MRLLKLTGLLIFMSMLAVGCSDDDEKETGGEPAELYVTVRDASDNYLLEGVDVEFVQNNKVLGVDTTDDTGVALCDNKWDGLVAGSVTINISVSGYKFFTKTGSVKAGDNEWEVRLTPEVVKETAMTVSSENVEDFYGVLVIDAEKDVASVRVSEGNKYDPEAYDEYTNSSYGTRGFIQRVTYTNLMPQTKYTFTAVSFDNNKKQLGTKTYSFTTKDWYNQSDKKLSIIDYLTIGNGISVKLQNYQRDEFYMLCYEKGKIPSNETQVVKEALSSDSKITNAEMGYVDGLKPGKEYRIYILPVGQMSIPNSPYYYEAPGKLAYMDLTTKDDQELAQATVRKTDSSKTSFSYRFFSSYYNTYGGNYPDLCLSFRGVTMEDYDQLESEPDIVWATLCHSKSLNVFTSEYTDIYTWSGLNLTSWYGIVTLGYSDKNGQNNSGIISRYKFKYGSYGVQTRSVETVAPVQTSGIRYGGITQDMLKRVRPL